MPDIIIIMEKEMPDITSKKAQLEENNEWVGSLFLDPWQMRSLDRDIDLSKIVDDDAPVDKPPEHPVVLYDPNFDKPLEDYQNVVPHYFIGPLEYHQTREEK